MTPVGARGKHRLLVGLGGARDADSSRACSAKTGVTAATTRSAGDAGSAAGAVTAGVSGRACEACASSLPTEAVPAGRDPECGRHENETGPDSVTLDAQSHRAEIPVSICGGPDAGPERVPPAPLFAARHYLTTEQASSISQFCSRVNGGPSGAPVFVVLVLARALRSTARSVSPSCRPECLASSPTQPTPRRSRPWGSRACSCALPADWTTRPTGPRLPSAPRLSGKAGRGRGDGGLARLGLPALRSGGDGSCRPSAEMAVLLAGRDGGRRRCRRGGGFGRSRRCSMVA